MIKKIFLFFFALFFFNITFAEENTMILKLKDGDVQFGNSNLGTFDLTRAGTGGSEYPDL